MSLLLPFVLTVTSVIKFVIFHAHNMKQRDYTSIKTCFIICNLICSLHEHILWIFKLIRRSFATAVTFLSLMLPHTVLCVIIIRCNILFTTIIACKGKMQVFPCCKRKIILCDLKCQCDKHSLPEKACLMKICFSLDLKKLILFLKTI